MDNNIKEVITGTNTELIKTLSGKEKNNALEVVALVYEDGSIEVAEYSDYESREVFVKEMMQLLKDNKIRNDQITKLDVNSKKIQKILEKANKEKLFDEMGVNNLIYDPKEAKKEHKLLKRFGIGAGAVVVAGTLIAGGVQLHKSLANSKEEPTNDNVVTDVVEEEGYGFYKYDLSLVLDMDEYESTVVDSEQKTGALNRLNILKAVNQPITLVDGETKQLTGLTIEQLIAVDAYVNSNIYETEDYIKNFGLYDFSSVTDDFQQSVLVIGASLANKEFDGTEIADIFKDEKVKNNYLKQLEYRDKILNAETSKEQKQLAKEYVEFLNDCSINQASSEYLDYDQHPGMAFATSVVVNALNYHNIKLDKEVVSEIIIIGDEDTQSKINSSNADVFNKLESATQFVTTMQEALADNEMYRIHNENERVKAETEEGYIPNYVSLRYEELDAIVREKLCDQTQINELTNKTLEKEEKLVTTEDQQLILANAVNIQRQLLDSGKGYYKDEQTAKLAAQLINVGDTATVTQNGVKFDTPEETAKIEDEAEDQTDDAKDKINSEQGLIDNSTPDKQQETENKIDNDIEQAEQEGIAYYNKVVNYYAANGDVAGIPAELQEAYNKLGADTFGLAKQTGIAKYMTNNQNKITGGEVNITIDPTVNPTDISENSSSDEVKIPATTPEVPSTPEGEQNTAPEDESSKTPEDTEQKPTLPEEGQVTIPDSTPSGEIQINPDLGDIDISDISTNPESTEIPSGFAPIVSEEEIANYSLIDIYGLDEYSDFTEEYSVSSGDAYTKTK